MKSLSPKKIILSILGLDILIALLWLSIENYKIPLALFGVNVLLVGFLAMSDALIDAKTDLKISLNSLFVSIVVGILQGWRGGNYDLAMQAFTVCMVFVVLRLVLVRLFFYLRKHGVF